jgi:hypothetical protein
MLMDVLHSSFIHARLSISKHKYSDFFFCVWVFLNGVLRLYMLKFELVCLISSGIDKSI